MRPGEKVNILLVDDHEENLLAIEAILSSVSHQLVKALSGREALRHLLTEEFAVILLDVRMPSLDGFETAALIRDREKTRHIPIIFLTAHGKEEDEMMRGYALGAVDYLFKPFVPDILRAKVEVLVDLHRKTAQIQRLNETLEQRATELEQANGALEREVVERRKAEEQLAMAVTGARLGTWHWNLITQNMVWSDRCRELFGVEPEEPLNYERFQEALHPDDRERVHQSVTQALLEKTAYDIEYRSLWSDGTLHWIAAKGLGYYDAEGKAVQMQGVVLDITERKLQEEKLTELNRELQRRTVELEAANKELEAFAYSVSHDLRAPLRHIDGFSELLGKHAATLDDEGRRYLKTISESAKQMGTLIDDLLKFSGVGRAELRQSVVSLDQLVKESLASLKQDMDGRKIAWMIGSLPDVHGDPALLRQVFVNLLSNAVKYTRGREQAKIEIGAMPPGKPEEVIGQGSMVNGEKKNEVIVYVRDNGAGFDRQYAHKLFGVFQRLHGPSEFEGTGIGLALVQRIIHRHGGRVWAEGAVDKGATFYFSLPTKAGAGHEARGT